MRYNQTFPALESFDPELSFFVAEHTPEPADTPPFADIPTALGTKSSPDTPDPMTPDIRPPANSIIVDAADLSRVISMPLSKSLTPHGLCMLCVEYDPRNFRGDTTLCTERPCAVRTGCESPPPNETHSVLFLSPHKFVEFRLEYDLKVSEHHKASRTPDPTCGDPPTESNE